MPLDHAAPTGPVARIAMLRQRALDPAARIGSLFVDPGGPGSSGVSFLPGLAAALGDGEVAMRFDLIGFDPRGVGVSEPAIDCSTSAEIDAERADLDLDTSPEGVAQTAIGAEFAEQFRTAVRAMVLDGAVDPAQDPVQARLTQARGFQRAFDNFATWCAGQDGCPLGTDVSAASPALQELFAPLVDVPVPTADGRVLGYDDAMLGVLTGLYREALWDFLRAGLVGVGRGDGTNLLRLGDAYHERAPDGSYGNLVEAFEAITCADVGRITDRAVALEISRRAAELAPFADTGRGPSPAQELCSFWPVPPTGDPDPVQTAGLPTVLVVSSTGDPATPYENGVSLAAQLRARLLTVENDGHTVALQGINACADTTTVRYLVDLVLPAQGGTCAR